MRRRKRSSMRARNPPAPPGPARQALAWAAGRMRSRPAVLAAKSAWSAARRSAAPSPSFPGPTTTPCLKCAACLEIALGTDMDVREIDGASYNGVDEVRKLQDSLPYRPTRIWLYLVFVVAERGFFCLLSFSSAGLVV